VKKRFTGDLDRSQSWVIYWRVVEAQKNGFKCVWVVIGGCYRRETHALGCRPQKRSGDGEVWSKKGKKESIRPQ